MRGPDAVWAYYDELAPAPRHKSFADQVMLDALIHGGPIDAAIARVKGKVAAQLSTHQQPLQVPALELEDVRWGCRPPSTPPPRRGSFEAMMEMFVEKMGNRL